MSAIANIVVNDGQTTPVAHTFNPHLQEGGLSVWLDKVSGIVAGYIKAICRVNSDVVDSDVNRIKFSVELPTLETLAPNSSGFTPGPTVAYVSRAVIEYIVPKRATAQERKDLAAYTANFANHATIKAMVTDGDFPW